jgi:uncharacterized protein (TIGR00375 family)
MEPRQLAVWAEKKGVNLLGTGDFTHPVYLAELKKILEPAEPGLFRLRSHSYQTVGEEGIRFVLSAEVGLIFKQNEKWRKIHLIIVAPSFEVVDRINTRFSTYGDLEEDGRPKLWFPLTDCIDAVRSISDACWLIPAHIWSPWFSLFGAFSGFDSLEEALGGHLSAIDGVETGLSSDPAMNRRVSALDRIPLISSSDAHSLPKLGREATVLEAPADLEAIRSAIRSDDPSRFLYTIEFYPEEGKYHYDGHRTCKVSLSPEETQKHQQKCPICGKRLTIGVLHRVEDLSDRPEAKQPREKIPARYLVPLIEIVAEAMGKRVEAKGVIDTYERLIASGGNEMKMLIDLPPEALASFVPPLILEGILRMRSGKVTKRPGYDGLYGKISVLK